MVNDMANKLKQYMLTTKKLGMSLYVWSGRRVHADYLALAARDRIYASTDRPTNRNYHISLARASLAAARVQREIGFSPRTLGTVEGCVLTWQKRQRVVAKSLVFAMRYGGQQ
jgi:hypothetical protein